MKNLIRELKAENKKRIKDTVSRFHRELKESENLTYIERNVLNRKTIYKKSRISQVEKRISEIYSKQLNKELEKIERVNNSSDKLSNDLTLIINFYKSSTWGYCPKGSDNYGNKTDSITGCGYCKESTATAQLLNQNEIILKRLYQHVNNNKKLSYGVSTSKNYLPYFSGGVGVSCHETILRELGYKVTLSGNNSTTVLTVSEV